MHNAIDDTQILELQDGTKKLCTRCRRYVSYDDFHYSRAAADHRQAWCKECKQAYRLEHAAAIEARKEALRKLYEPIVRQFESTNKADQRTIIIIHKEILSSFGQ